MALVITKGFGSDLSTFDISSVNAMPDFIDLTFNAALQPLALQAADPTNWVITNLTGTVVVTCTAVSLLSASVVRLIITEPHGGDTYRLTIPASGVKSVGGEAYNGAGAVDFEGLGYAPYLALAQAPDARTLRLTYSEAVIDTDATDASNYSISPTLAVISVAKETDNVYILTTAPQTPAQLYTLTVSNVRDLSLNPV